MGVATAVAVGGAVAGVAGSAMQAKAANKASKRAADAAAYKPNSIIGLGQGSTSVVRNEHGGFDTVINQNSTLTQIQKDAISQAQASGAPLPPELQQALDQSRYDSVANNQGLTDAANQITIDTVQRDQALQAAANGSQNSQDLSGLLNQNTQNIFQQGPQNQQEAEYLKSQGQGLLSSNYDQQRDQHLSLLREQAQPFEDQASSNFQADLFKRGVLNDSSGSGLLAQQFGAGLAQADLGRQQAASQFGNQLQQQDRQLGANLFQQGVSTDFQGQANFNQQLNSSSQLSGNLGQQGAQQAQNGAAFGLGFNEAQFNRAQGRIQNNQNMLGFANQAEAGRQQLQNGYLGTFNGIDNQQLNAIGVSQNGSQIQSAAGANQANYLNQQQSVWGPSLQQFGQGLMSSGAAAINTQQPGGFPEFTYNMPPRR